MYAELGKKFSSRKLPLENHHHLHPCIRQIWYILPDYEIIWNLEQTCGVCGMVRRPKICTVF